MSKGLKYYWHKLIYIDPLTPLGKVPLYKKAARFIYTLGKVFIRTYGFQRAAALSFATLFGIFPLVGVLLFLVPIFFGTEGRDLEVRRFILDYILPAGGDLKSTLESYFDLYQTRATQIGVLGLIALLAAGIALFLVIEQTFNDIWRVTRRRSLLKASTVFAGVIVWMPLFIGLSIYVARTFARRTFMGSPDFMSLLPFFLVFLGLTLAYILIPNTRVKLSSAVAGAFLAAILWEFAHSLFDRWLKLAADYNPAYKLIQSLGAIPYFIIWLYITWMIILLGIIIAYCTQNYKLLLREDITYGARVIDPVVLFMLLYYIGKKFVSREGGVSLDELRRLCPLPPKDFDEHLHFLEQERLIMRANENEMVILAQPPEKIILSEFLKVAPKAKKLFHFPVVDEAATNFFEQLTKMDNELQAVLEHKSLETFLK